MISTVGCEDADLGVPEMVERTCEPSLVSSHRQILPLFVVLALLLPAVLRGQEPSREPVPSEMLRDGELVVGTRNFAVRTPAGDWQWFLMKRQQGALSLDVYLCEEAGSGALFQVASMGVRRVIGAESIRGFEDGLKESLAAGGMKLVSMEITDSPVPVPHSRRGQWHALLPDGQSIYGYAYLVASETLLNFDHVTTEVTEPPEFTEFVKTYRILHAPFPRITPEMLVQFYFLLIGVSCLMAWVVNHSWGRVILNGGTLALILVILVLIVRLVIGGCVFFSSSQSSDEFSAYMGRRVGESIIPLVAAVLISRAFRRPDRATSAPGGEPQASQDQ